MRVAATFDELVAEDAEAADRGLALVTANARDPHSRRAAAALMVQVPAFLGLVLNAKTIKGCWYGSSNTHEDVLKLDELISREIKVDDVNEAFEAMGSGEVARSVILY